MVIQYYFHVLPGLISVDSTVICTYMCQTFIESFPNHAHVHSPTINVITNLLHTAALINLFQPQHPCSQAETVYQFPSPTKIDFVLPG